MDYQKVFDFVKSKHAGQTHANDVPVWYHLGRVSTRLDFLLNTYEEGTPEQRRVISTAALGHDLLEDTTATDEEILPFFGHVGLKLIREMTNAGGDHADVTPYVQQIMHSSEETKLIKLSDLYDNISAVTYTFSVLGSKWIHSFFLRVITPMREAILREKFTKYPLTAAHLQKDVDRAFTLLIKVTNGFKK
jgi:(p)ppGpp synthase/HD superfamily hydrolase